MSIVTTSKNVLLAAVFCCWANVVASETTFDGDEARRADVASWASWHGAWEGELSNILAPVGLEASPDTPFKVRVEITSTGYSLFAQQVEGHWRKYPGIATGLATNKIAASLLIHNSRGGFTEILAITLTRSVDDRAEATMLRTVTNWVLPETDKLHRFITLAEGQLSRMETSGVTK